MPMTSIFFWVILHHFVVDYLNLLNITTIRVKPINSINSEAFASEFLENLENVFHGIGSRS